MYISTILLLAALAGSTIAQLVPPPSASADPDKPKKRPISKHDCPPIIRPAQRPPGKRGEYTLVRQDGSVCPSNREKQWTGTIDVADTRRLFFWVFESRNDPVNDPVIFWLNGGPGDSSMIGAFTEIGACMLRNDSESPYPNPWSWNSNANLVFLEQPAGVGFSTISRGGILPAQDMDGAEDFQQFLNIFFRDVFPKQAHLPIHIATKAYGGHYGPTYVQHIMDSRHKDGPTAFWGNITSMILVDAVIDFGGLMSGFYELLCKDKRGTEVLTKDQCVEMSQALPMLETLARQCEETLDIEKCAAVPAYAGKKITADYSELIGKGLRSGDHLYHPCLDPPDCHRPDIGNLSEYMNRREVRERLDLPECFPFLEKNPTFEMAYVESGSAWVPTTHKVGAILDTHKRPKLVFDGSRIGDVRIMVLNGNLDPIGNTHGNMAVYDRIEWSGRDEYRIATWQALKVEEVKATGSWKGTKDGRLVFVAVDGAGGMLSTDRPETSYRILERWLRNGWRAP